MCVNHNLALKAANKQLSVNSRTDASACYYFLSVVTCQQKRWRKKSWLPEAKHELLEWLRLTITSINNCINNTGCEIKDEEAINLQIKGKNSGI